MTRRVYGLGLLLLLLVSTAACRESPSVSTVRSQLENQIPEARFEKDFHIRLGRVSLGLLKPLVRMGLDEDEEEMAWIRAIKRLEVGTYRVVSLPDTASVAPPPDLVRKLERKGWSTLVKVLEQGAMTMVLLREDAHGEIRGLFVLELDQDEMTLVSLEGRLSRVMAETLADEPGMLAGMFGP